MMCSMLSTTLVVVVDTIVFAEAIQNELQVAKEDDDTSIAQQPMDEGSTQDPPKPDKKDGQQQNMETD